MKFDLNSTVVLLADVLDTPLAKGDIGVVVCVFDTPREAYEVEFCDINGKTIAQLAMMPDQIAPFPKDQ